MRAFLKSGKVRAYSQKIAYFVCRCAAAAKLHILSNYMKYTVKEIAAITGSDFRGADSRVRAVVTDSRVANIPAAAVFVAIAGAHHDGHNYIDQLYNKGVRAFIIDKPFDTEMYPDAGFVISYDSLRVLQSLAAHHRRQFKGTMVAITGSNGKTITKEWIAQLCPDNVKLFRSPRSYNSQLGVALSILMLEGDERIAVIEAGISQKSEMAHLEEIIAPDVGIFTTLGDAHQENFGTLEEKLREKLGLFKRAGTVIYNSEEPMVGDTITELCTGCRLFPVTKGTYDLTGFPFSDDASLMDVSLALMLYEALGYDPEKVLRSLPLLQSVAMRLELKEGINGNRIINDSYNSDINSLSIALDYLATVAASRERVLVLSDILQSGLFPAELYSRVAGLIEAKGVNHLIGIGEEISRNSHLFNVRKDFYSTTEDFLNTYRRSEFVNKAVLLKGSRPFHFEKISRALESKTHTTVLEVNLDNMIHNLNYFRGKLQQGVQVMAMVKALSYGSGTYEVANMLQGQGVGFLAVAFADEGVTLREAGITMRIVVLNADGDTFDLMIEYDLEPEIYSFTSLNAFAAAVRRHGETNYPVHLKLDTGMHRLGFEDKDTEALIAVLKSQPAVYVRSVFSHLSGSDEQRHDDFTRAQIALFDRVSSRITDAFSGYGIIRHIANSAAIERFPEAQFDMVRLGIGLYGVSAAHQENLLPVSTLKSRIVQIKTLAEGETVGYGRHGVAKGTARIATVPVGYADGLDRHLSRGCWSFTVNGQRAPVIGNICMDTCMIDITGINAAEGDTVVIFGDDPTVIEMAECLGTIPYEILTSISARVKRVYLKE